MGLRALIRCLEAFLLSLVNFAFPNRKDLLDYLFFPFERCTAYCLQSGRIDQLGYYYIHQLLTILSFLFFFPHVVYVLLNAAPNFFFISPFVMSYVIQTRVNLEYRYVFRTCMSLSFSFFTYLHNDILHTNA